MRSYHNWDIIEGGYNEHEDEGVLSNAEKTSLKDFSEEKGQKNFVYEFLRGRRIDF